MWCRCATIATPSMGGANHCLWLSSARVVGDEVQFCGKLLKSMQVYVKKYLPEVFLRLVETLRV